MWAPTKTLNTLQVNNPDAILNTIEDLRTHKSGINWVKLGYEGQALELKETGRGGVEELKKFIKNDEICFAVLEVTVKGDEYNPVKFMFITWIGPQVPPGIMKAKSAAHRKDLLDFIQTKIAIASEYQPLTTDDLNPQSIADKLTRVAQHEVDNVDDKKRNMSRPDPNAAPKSTSKAEFNEQELKDALIKVHRGEHRWAAMAYIKKDQIGYVTSGTDLESLKSIFPKDKILFAVVTQTVKETTNITTKILLVTMVGENTGALVKAKSSAHRAELADYVKSVIPFHSFYQADSTDDISEDRFLQKLRQ